MRIQTGHGTIPLITLIGIWSISALNALPGLAVSPILGKLSAIFPHSTELDIQMLSSLPSLLIIPFILLAGKLTERVNFIRLLQAGLAIFALSGVLYLLSGQMWQLIAVSALLGVGSGLIVPLSTGLISKYFVGSYRVKQFGLSSAITNITLVVATAVTGYLAEVNWHLPFVVYLLPIISLVLSVYLQRSMASEGSTSLTNDKAPADKEEDVDTGNSKYGIHVRHLAGIMGVYGLATFLVLVVSFNLPFLMEEYHFTSGNSGIMISLFFLAIMTPGFFLNRIVGTLKEKTKFYSFLSIGIGLALIWISPKEWVIAPGCILVGLGVRSYPTCCLQPDNPYGYFTQSDTGTGIRNGDELSCHPAMSLHYRLLPVDCIPHQISAVCFCIQSMHQHRNACHFLYQAKFFLV